MAMISSGRALAHGLPYSPVAILCAVTLFASELASQPGGKVTGTVTAANKIAIPQARVRLVGTTLAAVTQADGTFEVTQVPAGPGTIEITMIGYTPKTLAIVLTPGETLDLKFSLDPLPLETVTVTAEPNFFLGMGGFQERRARGSGRYFSRDEILRMHPRQVTDVLRRVPGMQIQFGSGGLGGGNQTARSSRSSSVGAQSCAMTYYVNGSPFPLSGDMSSINHYVATEDIAAIEVYTGSSEIPAEFNSSLHSARCGVVAIWTSSKLDSRTAHH